MIVTFCGHNTFKKSEEYEQQILVALEKKVGNRSADMYLGGYGEFDAFVYECCKKFKETHPQISLVLVTPYLTIEYQKNHLDFHKERYDSIIYPEIENMPKRYAITYRNRFMIEKSDYVIAYVTHCWGGAYTTYKYAKQKGKEVFNLADFS